MAVGIRKKILLGFIAIGFILLLSGVVAIFEMTRLTDIISGLLTNNIQTVTSANAIDQIVLKQDSCIRNIVQDEFYIQQDELSKDTVTLTEHLDFIASNITIVEEQPLAENLKVELKKYKLLLNTIPNVMELQKEQRTIWYEGYSKLLISLIGTTAKIEKLNQDALLENTVKLEGNYYRMIMPAVIAILAGVFMIFFFNYFINSYFINPVIQVKDNIKSFLSSRTPYSVKVKTNDEINELNEEVKDLVSLLKKREKECSSLQNEKREA